jgi:hypothetical protein
MHPYNTSIHPYIHTQQHLLSRLYARERANLALFVPLFNVVHGADAPGELAHLLASVLVPIVAVQAKHILVVTRPVGFSKLTNAVVSLRNRACNSHYTTSLLRTASRLKCEHTWRVRCKEIENHSPAMLRLVGVWEPVEADARNEETAKQVCQRVPGA